MNIRIGKKIVGENMPAFIIAEIGINHNGKLEIAKDLIDLAVSAGADAVKFQKRTIDLVYSKEILDKVGNIIADALDSLLLDEEKRSTIIQEARKSVIELCSKYPIYKEAY